MEFTDDRRTLGEWMPLVMDGRDPSEVVAATRMVTGADVDYGALTRNLMTYLEGLEGFAAHYSHRVRDVAREPGGRWRVEIEDGRSGERRSTTAKFVFLGAGGGALPLLQASGIPEGQGYGGVSGRGVLGGCGGPGGGKRQEAHGDREGAGGAPPPSVAPP